MHTVVFQENIETFMLFFFFLIKLPSMQALNTVPLKVVTYFYYLFLTHCWSVRTMFGPVYNAAASSVVLHSILGIMMKLKSKLGSGLSLMRKSN